MGLDSEWTDPIGWFDGAMKDEERSMEQEGEIMRRETNERDLKRKKRCKWKIRVMGRSENGFFLYLKIMINF